MSLLRLQWDTGKSPRRHAHNSDRNSNRLDGGREALGFSVVLGEAQSASCTKFPNKISNLDRLPLRVSVLR